MPNEVLQKNGTLVVFADTTDYSSTNSGYTRTHQISLASLAASGRAQQSAKADLGATRAAKYAVRVGIEFDIAPTAGGTVEFWWSASASATAGTGNDAGASGTDTGYQASAAEVDEFKVQATFIGSLQVTADAATTVQYGTVGVLYPPERYGQVIVVNEADQAFEGDDVEMFVALIPIVDEIQ